MNGIIIDFLNSFKNPLLAYSKVHKIKFVKLWPNSLFLCKIIVAVYNEPEKHAHEKIKLYLHCTTFVYTVQSFCFNISHRGETNLSAL